ncbi:hypothetical protein EIP91_009135 [Steccherinum ochraceum]|uniref:Uncharacterized protein n=1 Tax=Steccherinum ochraceum TaxID=92696 RepID=A0A4R0R207_9APHY|nr:hypothetical protein EIP91_009135 [Steccherinum ochraceum]
MSIARKMIPENTKASSPPPTAHIRDLLKVDLTLYTPTQRSDLVSDLDAAILRSGSDRALLQRLRAKRKVAQQAYAIIHCIPAEILLEIMWFAMDQNQDSRGSLSVVPLSHVSRRWRDVALSSQRLWAYVIIWFEDITVEALDLILGRASSCPLVVELGPSLTYQEKADDARAHREILRRILHHMSHIANLTMDLEDWSDGYDILAALVSASAPLLTRLHITLPNDFDKIIRLPFVNAGHVPSLTVVNIGYLIHSEILSFLPGSSVTALTIYGSLGYIGEEENATIILALLSAFRSMPHLHVFRLFMNGLRTESLEDIDVESVSLPQLSIMEINGYVYDLTWFLGHLHFPPTTAITLHFFAWCDVSNHTFQEKFVQLLSHRMSHTKADQWAVAWRLQREDRYTKHDLTYYSRFYIPSEHMVHSRNELDSQFGVTLAADSRPADVELMVKIWDEIPSENISRLVLEDSLLDYPSSILTMQQPVLIHLARSLPFVQTLVSQWSIEWFADTDLLLQAQEPVSKGKTEGTTAFLFPRLRELSLRWPVGKVSDDWGWHQTKWKQAFYRPYAILPRRVVVLRMALRSWEAERGPLERISFWESDVSDEDVQQLGL